MPSRAWLLVPLLPSPPLPLAQFPALVEIVLMWGAILATIVAFAGVNKIAAGLLVPYLGW